MIDNVLPFVLITFEHTTVDDTRYVNVIKILKMCLRFNLAYQFQKNCTYTFENLLSLFIFKVEKSIVNIGDIYRCIVQSLPRIKTYMHASLYVLNTRKINVLTSYLLLVTARISMYK